MSCKSHAIPALPGRAGNPAHLSNPPANSAISRPLSLEMDGIVGKIPIVTFTL
jgi:hypothetical protein